MPGARGGQKDDARDALELAEGLRTGTIKQQVYKACGPYSELRAAVRSYGILRCDVARAKNRLKALYRSRGMATPGNEVYQAGKHEAWEKLLTIAATAVGSVSLLGDRGTGGSVDSSGATATGGLQAAQDHPHSFDGTGHRPDSCGRDRGDSRDAPSLPDQPSVLGVLRSRDCDAFLVGLGPKPAGSMGAFEQVPDARTQSKPPAHAQVRIQRCSVAGGNVYDEPSPARRLPGS